MECLGGNGYVEEGGEGVMARIYREMPLNSIWEGAGNIMALDLLRALRKGEAMAACLERELAPARGAAPRFDRLAASLPARIDEAADESEARRLARDVALARAGRAAATACAEPCVRGLLPRPDRGRGRLGVRPAAGRHRRRRADRARDAALTRRPPMSAELILHHYPTSPFSEKVRLVLGAKELTWRSVRIPVIMPKPDVLALTGGYRRTPLLQIGADIYCDTALICRVLDRAATRAAAVPGRRPPAPRRCWPQWADSTLFWTAVPFAMQPAAAPYLFGDTPPEAIKAFGADRASFGPQTRRNSLADGGNTLQHYLAWLETHLGDDRGFLVRRRAQHRRLRGLPPAVVPATRARAGAPAGAASAAARLARAHARIRPWHGEQDDEHRGHRAGGHHRSPRAGRGRARRSASRPASASRSPPPTTAPIPRPACWSA